MAETLGMRVFVALVWLALIRSRSTGEEHLIKYVNLYLGGETIIICKCNI